MVEKGQAWHHRWPVFIRRGGPTSGHRGHKGRALEVVRQWRLALLFRTLPTVYIMAALWGALCAL